MNSLIYLFRFIYRIRWWLLIGPALAALFVIYKTQKMSHTYQTRTTIYTGAVSGYSIDPDDSGKQDWASTNNTMDNLVNIIVSQSTLRNVSLRLFAQAMMYGSPDKNTNHISAANYRTLMRHVPKEVVALIDKNSEENTLANLEDYEKASPDNYVYGLFHYTHRHYSYQALSKIVVKRLGNSDMIQVSYESDDPGIAYNTLVLLNEEFVKQYKDLRFGETNNVIKYFEQELERTRKVLTEAEDSLRDYNVEKRVINYDEQTKHVAVLSRDFELRYEDTRIELANTQRLMEVMDDRIDEHVKQLRNNTLFVDKLRTISNLTARITTLESFQNDTLAQALDQPLTARPAGSSTTSISSLKQQLAKAQGELTELTHALGTQYYTKEGLSTSTLVDQWLDVLIRNEKAKAEMKVLQEWKDRLDDRYVFYAPESDQPALVPDRSDAHQAQGDGTGRILRHDDLHPRLLHPARTARPDAARPGTHRTDYRRTRAGRLPRTRKIPVPKLHESMQTGGLAISGQCGTQLFQTREAQRHQPAKHRHRHRQKFPRRTTQNLLRRDRAKRPAGHLSSGFHRRAEKLPARAEPQRLHSCLGPEAGRRT